MRCPTILLLGDSIHIGYREFVKHGLLGKCRVVYPKEQGKSVVDIHRMLYEWNRDLPVDENLDFVYFNAGLWDVVRVFGDNPEIPIEVYQTYVKRLAIRLRKLYPKALICFAATTPVNEAMYGKNFFRNNDEIIAYNNVVRLLVGGGIDVYDDLYSLVNSLMKSDYVLYKDATHFNNEMNLKLSEHIIKTIEKMLQSKIQVYVKESEVYMEKVTKLIEQIVKEKIDVPVVAWGAGRTFETYCNLIIKYCDLRSVVDRNERLQGHVMRGIKCISPKDISSDISLVIITVENKNAQVEIKDFCKEMNIAACTIEDYLKIVWSEYEEEYLLTVKHLFKDYNPEAKAIMQKYIGINIPENICSLDCQYCYLSLNPNRRFENINNNNPHLPLFIRWQLRREILGGSCLIGLTASGETLVADKIVEVCCELLKEGHYLHIVTNGLATQKIKEIIYEARGYAKNILFKLSFHYLELSKKNLLNKFVESVRVIEDSAASYTIELMPHDELIPYISDVLSFSKEHFGAYPHLTIGRNNKAGYKLLTKQTFREYYNTWKVFDSEMFEMRMKLYLTKGTNCNAGRLSFFFNLYTGQMKRCVFHENAGNLYLDGLSKDGFERVGDFCPLESCYNCHVYAPFGILPTDSPVPTYMTIRDRIKTNGEHWIKKDMREFLDIKLHE